MPVLPQLDAILYLFNRWIAFCSSRNTMTIHKKHQVITPVYLVLLSLLFMGCKKEGVSPIVAEKTAMAQPAQAKAAGIKADSVNTTTNDLTDTSNPEYWYNGTTGTALLRVSCKECTAIATIGNTTVPFMINDEGVGVLKYTPKPGLAIKIAVCPSGTKALNVHILDANKETLFTYVGIITANWLGGVVVK